MRIYLCAVVISLMEMSAVGSASACIMMVERNLEDVKYANVVVIGRVVNYEIIRDEVFRKQYKEGLERSANKSSAYWAAEYARATSKTERFLSDYARFTVLVDEAIVGNPSKSITVTWDNSTFGEPETMEEGPYLIALREPSSDRPPLRGPSATILPSPEPSSLIVLQAPCASAFIFKATSPEIKTIRNILASPNDRKADRENKGQP